MVSENSKCRLRYLRHFYDVLANLERKIGGARRLAHCTGRMDWPQRGIYFFREMNENRQDSGAGPRIVRVGTHALKHRSSTSLWTRLSQHRGQARSGGGNHRGSIFRLIVGAALVERDGLTCPTWQQGNTASRECREAEQHLEQIVSKVIGDMPFLWLAIDDEPGPDSLRGFIERNAIALLSNFGKDALDPPSRSWLGKSCDRKRVRESGLWNSNHVDQDFDPTFLDTMDSLVDTMGKSL